MEPIIVIVGFLGAGKTTLLKKLVQEFLSEKWSPYIILNDYENAYLDSQDFLQYLSPSEVKALSGSCICCSGINELREQVNNIPKRERGITLIEANGTTDAVSLMGFLGIGMQDHFLPPIQIAVVDARNWQKRGYHNELEANQIQVSSLVILNYADELAIEDRVILEEKVRKVNQSAQILAWNKFDLRNLSYLNPSENIASKMEHGKSHWSSCSINLPESMSYEKVEDLLKSIPKSILRVKGFTRFGDDDFYSYFERTPVGEIFTRPYQGTLIKEPKLLTIGPGSDPEMLKSLLS